MKTIKELEKEMKHFDDIMLDKNTIIYQCLKTELETLRNVLKLINEWKKENNCVLSTEDIIKEKIVMADYFKWDKLYELKDLISGTSE